MGLTKLTDENSFFFPHLKNKPLPSLPSSLPPSLPHLLRSCIGQGSRVPLPVHGQHPSLRINHLDTIVLHGVVRGCDHQTYIQEKEGEQKTICKPRVKGGSNEVDARLPPNTLFPLPLLSHITYHLPSTRHGTQRRQDAHPHKGGLEKLGLVAEACVRGREGRREGSRRVCE